MTEHYRFFDGIEGDERAYSAAEFAEYFRQFLRNGIFAGGENLQVSTPGGGMATYVKPGYAWINGYMYKNDADLYLTHAPAHPALPRIDRVVLRLDLSEEARYVRAFVLTGEPAADPKPPEITREGDVYELALAQVLIEANVASINPANITDERFDSELCGLATYYTLDLVPRSDAVLLKTLPEFQLAAQNPRLMARMAEQFLVMDVVANNRVAMEAVVSSETAMETVVSSKTAMEAVAASEVAMEAVVQSEVAMEAVAASEVAMEAVAASEVAMEAIFDSWLARLAIWESEMASQIIMQQARAWLEANVAEEAYRQSASSEFAMVVDKKGLLLAIRHDYDTVFESTVNGEMQVFAQAPTARSYTDIVGGNLAADTWYDVAYRMENFQVKNRQSGTTTRRLDFRYVPMEP